jgi:hypothetical protein
MRGVSHRSLALLLSAALIAATGGRERGEGEEKMKLGFRPAAAGRCFCFLAPLSVGRWILSNGSDL